MQLPPDTVVDDWVRVHMQELLTGKVLSSQRQQAINLRLQLRPVTASNDYFDARRLLPRSHPPL